MLSAITSKFRSTSTDDAQVDSEIPELTEDGPKYQKSNRSTLKRYAKRGNYDRAQIHSLVNTTQVLHVSFSPDTDDPFPAILPMIGQMGSYAEPDADVSAPMDCYLHGYVSSRIMRLARAQTNGDDDEDAPQGLPVCIAASKVDGLVLSLTPNSHSYNYRSAVLFGHATLVEDDAEKLWAMSLVTNSVVPGRYNATRVPPNKTEMTSTNVLRVRIAEGSIKVRLGTTHDDKADLSDESVTERVWTGVVPVWESFGEPVESPTNKLKTVPSYIKDFITRKNKVNEKYAKHVATLD